MMARFDRRTTDASRCWTTRNIARILDAGITEQGRPYVVVEHVPGQPLTRFADQRRLTIEQRLDLFPRHLRRRAACAPARRHHRDLKPSNVLVAEGRPSRYREDHRPSTSPRR
jgi:serine/threonine protein kinase